MQYKEFISDYLYCHYFLYFFRSRKEISIAKEERKMYKNLEISFYIFDILWKIFGLVV